jgi:signal transduction histidine kinase
MLERVDPRELLQEVINSNKMQARSKRHGIFLLIDKSVPKFIETDAMRLQQIVNNLLSNAIKFSDEGTRIDIESFYMPDKDLFQVNVIDNGVHISDEEAETLFQPHSTLKYARDINAAGPGLGLYMCKCLCLQMGGDIKLLNNIRPTIGSKAFVLNVAAKALQDPVTDEIMDMDLIGF